VIEWAGIFARMSRLVEKTCDPTPRSLGSTEVFGFEFARSRLHIASASGIVRLVAAVLSDEVSGGNLRLSDLNF
jgi:hypothetical protein